MTGPVWKPGLSDRCPLLCVDRGRDDEDKKINIALLFSWNKNIYKKTETQITKINMNQTLNIN